MSLYHQNPLSDQAFDEVNNILDDDSPSQVQVLHFKMNELQKIIKSLTMTNQRLIQRIEQLQDEVQAKNQEQKANDFNEEYSIMGGDLNDVDQLVKQYKENLQKYHQKYNRQLQQKNITINQLQQEVDQLRNLNDRTRTKLENLENQNQMLLQTKQTLIGQIEQLENSLRKSKAESPRYGGYSEYSNDYLSRYQSQYGGSNNDFGYNVQLELEKLIEKLVKELEHERNTKKKMTQEIKALQKDLMEQEKQIMSKNNKIYALEISAIKKNKINNSSIAVQRHHHGSPYRINFKGPEERPRATRDKEVVQSYKSRTKTFTLMQLMNECVILTSKEKLIIALKIVELFTRKLQRNDFKSELLECLTISNYSPSNAHLCQVKVNLSNMPPENQQEEDPTESSLLWNLVFILDNLFSQTPTKDRAFGQSDKEDIVLQAINYYLENKEANSMERVMELRKLVDQALAQHIR